MDYNMERRKQSQQQMRPIVRNLKAAAPPKFSQEIYDINENPNVTFKSNVFVNQSVQNVRISHYEKGVHMFYVQLESLDAQLQVLLTKIQSIKLINLKNRPTLIGMACLARHQKKIHRVAIAKIFNDNHESFLCHFVDYGYSAIIKFENLFYIPEPFLVHPTFAVQFTFAGLQNKTFKAPIQEVNFYFKQITENKLLSLKCVPIDGPPVCQYCELYYDDKNILNILQFYNPTDLKLPKAPRLDMNKDILVKVCYVQSVKEFYIHFHSSDILFKYDMMYDDLQKQLPTSPIVNKLRQNQYVGVVIESEWYRGRIVELTSNKLAHVEIVDFGIVEEIPSNTIRLLPNKFMDIPSFAYRCCLEGFEQSDVSENITTQFEMFCSDSHDDRKLFKMITDRFDDKLGYLAKLDDISVNPPANVNRILLKNSRPLAETITLENARKRHKETQKKNKDTTNVSRNEALPQEPPKDNNDNNNLKVNEKSRSNSQRGRGNQVGGRGVSRTSPPKNDVGNRRQRTHFDKSNIDANANSIAGTYYKTQKEANVWNDSKQQKSSSDWNQAKNIPKEQNSDSDWNETDSPTKKGVQKTKNSKGKGNKSNDNNGNQIQNNNNKQKSPPKHEKSPSIPNGKQKSPVVEENVQKSVENVKPKQNTLDKQLKCGWVSTLISTNEAFVHFEEHIDGLEKILDELFVFYEGQKAKPLRDIKAGMKTAYKSQDGNWYRCEILSVDSGYCTLRNQEYGNTENVQNKFIRALDDRFQKYGKLVEKAYFSIKPNEPQYDNNQLLKEMLTAFNEGAKELSFKMIKTFKDGHILDPFDPDTRENIIESLVTKKKMAVRINEGELTKILENNVKKEEEERKAIEENVTSTSSSQQQVVVSKNDSKKEEEPAQKQIEQPKADDVVEKALKTDRIVGKLTALTSPNDFYLTRVDMLQHFNQFHTDIQILAPALQPLIDFECGTFCLAQQPFDNLWYRAKIIDSDESIITVVCIDNGKTFSIDNKLCMKTMPEQMQQKSFFGISCSLPLKIERKCDEEATELMLKMVEKEVEYKILLNTPQLNYVELYFNNDNIGDLLIEKKYAQPYEIFSSGSGYTSHINSISDFFMQLEADQLKLDLIASIMERANGKFDKVIDPTVGQIVGAKYPEDDGWYRSKIESIESDGFTVKFIDYGNSCLVKEIGIIDPSIAELPSMAKHCTLFKPKNIVSFSDAAEKEFVKITANGETILNVKVVKAGDVTEVELFCDDQNIIDLLTPLCKLESDKSNDISDILN